MDVSLTIRPMGRGSLRSPHAIGGTPWIPYREGSATHSGSGATIVLADGETHFIWSQFLDKDGLHSYRMPTLEWGTLTQSISIVEVIFKVFGVMGLEVRL
jgi:hypothetical protein